MQADSIKCTRASLIGIASQNKVTSKIYLVKKNSCPVWRIMCLLSTNIKKLQMSVVVYPTEPTLVPKMEEVCGMF